MRQLLAALALVAVTAAPASAAITLQEAQDEFDAWVAPRLPGLTADFEACVATKALRDCHPTWSSTVLPNTKPADSALATVTNNDPGPFVSSICGDCFDDTKDTWVIAGVDIPATSPGQLRTNSFKSGVGVGIQLTGRVQYDGTIWEKGYGLFGIAEGFGWREVVVGP